MQADAFKMFKLASNGYCCSQILIILHLESNNIENVQLVKAMAGLCGGVGGQGKTCGIVTAGACLLGLYAGKGTEAESKDDNLKKMIKEYTDWFEEEYQSTECVDMVTVDVLKDINENEAYPVKCGMMLQKAYVKIHEILNEHGYID